MNNQPLIDAVRERTGLVEQQALAGQAFVEGQEERIREFLYEQIQEAARKLLEFANKHLDEFILVEGKTYWEVSGGKVELTGFDIELYLYLKITPNEVKVITSGDFLLLSELDLSRADPRQVLDILQRRLEKG